ncbi:MAG TPA: type II toxin-antitoxin system VapC family toxin [Rhizomicrobium sp.]
MLAIDTNVLLRFLTGDHPVQAARARRLVDNNDVLVLTTVLLEAEWVLRSVYKFERDAIAEGFATFAGLPRVTLEDFAAVAKALAWMKQGMDFADALHLSKAQDCDAFVSFDARLAKRASAVGALPVRLP